jgi:hypothetical protein
MINGVVTYGETSSRFKLVVIINRPPEGEKPSLHPS